MPTVLDYVREKDPGLKDVPDDKLKSYIKERFPGLAGSLPSEKKTPLFDLAKKRGLGIKQQEYQQQSKEAAGTEKDLGMARWEHPRSRRRLRMR